MSVVKQKDSKVAPKREKKQLQKSDVKRKNVVIVIGKDENSKVNVANISADPRLKEGDKIRASVYYKNHPAWNKDKQSWENRGSSSIDKFLKKYGSVAKAS